MSARPIQLPQDFDLIQHLAVDSFQYPDNPEWSIQSDEMPSIQDMVDQYKKIWPLVKFASLFSYQVRNAMQGFIWEEAGEPAGVVFLSSQNKDDWWISTLGVLPAFRRRGIARKLLQHCIDFFKAKQAKRAYLWVIAENFPARSLYENNGFVHFSSDIVFEHPGCEIEEPILPAGYVEIPLDRFDWKTRHAMATAITPPDVQKASPIQEKDFKTGFLMRLVAPLMDKAEGIKPLGLLYRSATTGEIAGRVEMLLRTRSGGKLHSQTRYVPGHEGLVNFLFQKILSIAKTENPGLRINVGLPAWQVTAVHAAQEAGFKIRMENCEMVLKLENEE
ncbi:MAG: GNAT family N-acetyltransferase [Anaerolineae bacterium]|jgi:GNAT superfamily N-acetyltransferase|nr:GNAT family N-acetyltransferase [Anaerolineae bacterium]